MGFTISALNTLANHTHPMVAAINEGSPVSTQATNITTQKSLLDPIKK